MKVLSLSSVFPNPAEPGLGLFVSARLQAMAQAAALKVVAPVPILDYTNPAGRIYRRRTFPSRRSEGQLEVFHPRWTFPPLGTPANVMCLSGRLFPLLRRIRQSFAFDVIDAHFAYPEGVAAAVLSKAFGIPFVVTLRGSETVFAGYESRKLSMRWALNSAARIITVSEELAQFAIKLGCPSGKVVTIPNGVDSGLFFFRNGLVARARHQIPPERKLIVSAGELIEAKGHQHVATAVRELFMEGYDVQLLIVGGTARGGRKYENDLRQHVQDLGIGDRIRFAGSVGRQGMAELLSAADVFCLASYTEGWPNVVHEALACGTPVVATRVGAIPEMLASNKVGLIVPPKDDPALVSALRSALQQSWNRDEIARVGSARTWDKVAAEVLSVFREIVPPYGVTSLKTCEVPSEGKLL